MILLARPYSQFVTAYDGMVGVEFFQRVRRAVAALVRRYEIRFWGRRILAENIGVRVNFQISNGCQTRVRWEQCSPSSELPAEESMIVRSSRAKSTAAKNCCVMSP